ncbi:DUF4174 domain-containing protein [Psychroserpens mesophilus]|uniref:DUF4174 domain-containing protein n=1 Tax=Psychroserpens mesophilus TaxID=325473 RepID=UPI003D64FD6E
MKYLILIMLMSNCLWSQNLDKHQWEERVLFIVADEDNLELAERQFDILIKDKKELIDRDLVLYKCLEEKCTFYNFKNKSETSKETTIFKGFKLVLIGLDGAEKYSTNTLVKTDVIFRLIDSMPMRRREVENRRKND